MKSKEKYQDKAKEREIEKEGNVNKINFKPDNNNKNSFFTEPLPPYNESNVSKKGPNYKICSLSMIKSKNEGSSQGEQPKKGIKLLGYNPSFPRKVEEWIVLIIMRSYISIQSHIISIKQSNPQISCSLKHVKGNIRFDIKLRQFIQTFPVVVMFEVQVGDDSLDYFCWVV